MIEINEMKTIADAAAIAAESNHDATIANNSSPDSSDRETRTNGKYNYAAIKRHGIKISIETRSGKFSRVSSEFIQNVEASIDAKLREFRRECLAFNGHSVDLEPGESFLTGEGKAKLIECFNIWIANEIHRQTKIQRTGKTL